MEYQSLSLIKNKSVNNYFKLNPVERKILSNTGEKKLRPKLWHVLVVLLQNENQLIEREALIDLVWKGNHFTGPQGVSHSICILRSIIAELGIPLLIITLPKRGYILQRATITATQSLASEFDVIKFDQSYG